MSWRFARTGKWIVRHVAVALLVVAMVSAGFWQLRRLDDKRAHKDLVEARQEEPIAPVEDVVPRDAAVDASAVDAVLYRPVGAVGRYLADETVVVENRTFNGASGGWVLTPLQLHDGLAVVVNRGFVGFTREGRIEAPPPPTGEVRVEGLVFPSQQRGSFGAVDPDEGQLDVLARVDLDRFDAQVDGDLLPAYIQLTTSDPPEPPRAADEPVLVALGEPEVGEGPHLAYAVQWFTFTVIAAGGYALLLRRVARRPGSRRDLTSMAPSTRERILEATYACVARLGMAKTTMEDIAREADLSRATLYRAFPGGRDEVLDAVVTWEVARFFRRVSDAIHPEELDTVAVLEQGLLAARDALEHHELLQRLLVEEADQLLPSLATVMPMVQTALADWYRPWLEAAALRPGVDPAEAADLVARMALSHLGTPGRWDLHDPDAVAELVRGRLLAGILAV